MSVAIAKILASAESDAQDLLEEQRMCRCRMFQVFNRTTMRDDAREDFCSNLSDEVDKLAQQLMSVERKIAYLRSELQKALVQEQRTAQMMLQVKNQMDQL